MKIKKKTWAEKKQQARKFLRDTLYKFIDNYTIDKVERFDMKIIADNMIEDIYPNRK